MKADFSFLVPPDSTITAIADADRHGIRISIVRNHAMDTALKLERAQRIYAEVPDTAFDLLRAGKADGLAGIRPGLLAYAKQFPGSRVLPDSYGANVLALAVAKGKTDRLAYVSEFIIEARATGVVQRAIDTANLSGIDVVTA
jgi:polar amino acid transport system substrate-binding protein